MGTPLYDPTIVKHDDLICILDAGYPMGDYYTGPFLHKGFKFI